MNKFNQLIKEIIQRQKKHAKEKASNQRSLKKALKYLKIKHENKVKRSEISPKGQK